MAHPRLSALLRSIAAAEAAAGWARLRRVPSTYAWKTIDYLAALPADRRERLIEAFAANALFLFDPDRDPTLHATAAGDEEYERLRSALPLMASWDYMNVRYLRSVLGEVRSGRPSAAAVGVPAAVLERAAAIQAITATDIRRAVKRSLGERFGARAENTGGGVWRYAAAHRGRPFAVVIDYGGRFGAQLRYEVAYDDAATGLRARRLTLERVCGVGFGDWDFLTADNVGASLALLGDFLEELVAIPDRLGAA